MKHVHTIQYHANTKEEQLPGYDKAFPIFLPQRIYANTRMPLYHGTGIRQ